MPSIIVLIIVSCAAMIIASCSGGSMDGVNKAAFPSIGDVSSESWKRLGAKKIYFGHQSVGYDILEGIGDVMKANPSIRLKIVETGDPKDFNNPVLGHSPVGKNTDPLSKCEDFLNAMAHGLGRKVDIAFFKFCYIDILEPTNVNTVFEEYRKSVDLVRKTFPAVVIVHVTAPLRVVQTGPAVWVKKLINRRIGGYDDNIRREQFNALVRKEYSGKEPVFDLARIESTFPDGSRATFEKDGKIYPALVPAYTNDGGHLNERGRKVVAEQLLVFLANLNK